VNIETHPPDFRLPYFFFLNHSSNAIYDLFEQKHTVRAVMMMIELMHKQVVHDRFAGGLDINFQLVFPDHRLDQWLKTTRDCELNPAVIKREVRTHGKSGRGNDYPAVVETPQSFFFDDLITDTLDPMRSHPLLLKLEIFGR
jgi:hypothetical protein